MTRKSEPNAKKTTSPDSETNRKKPRMHSEGAGTGLNVEDPQEAKNRLLDYVKKWLSDQKILSGVKIRKTANVFQETGQRLAQENQYVLSEYVSKSADRMQELSGYLEDRPVEEIPQDISELARDKPWLFMGGSLALGLVLTRYVLSSPPARAREPEGKESRDS